MQTGDVLEVQEGVYGKYIAEYTNGYETTAGLANKNARVVHSDHSITYDAYHKTELPVEWPAIKFFDDRGDYQKIACILWDNEDTPFKMENGYESSWVKG